MLSDECLKILEKKTKTKKDYYQFIDARLALIGDILSEWKIPSGDYDFDDAVEND